MNVVVVAVLVAVTGVALQAASPPVVLVVATLATSVATVMTVAVLAPRAKSVRLFRAAPHRKAATLIVLVLMTVALPHVVLMIVVSAALRHAAVMTVVSHRVQNAALRRATKVSLRALISVTASRLLPVQLARYLCHATLPKKVQNLRSLRAINF